MRFVKSFALTSGVLLAVGLAGCTSSSGGSRPAPSRTPHSSAPAHSTDATTTRLTGKFTASPLVFLDPRIGLITIGGFVGNSNEVSSWQERTTDGGRTWTPGSVTRTGDGRYPVPAPTTQVGLAFGSRSAGWAYQTSLFFTRDGGLTWHPQPGRPAAVGPVAPSGSSTWITGYACRDFHCPAQLFRTSRVGGPLTLLPAQPTRIGEIDVLLRPSRNTAWVVAADAHGRQRLITTADAGRTWQPRSSPCRSGDQFVISGDRPAALYLMCDEPSLSMCSTCGARVLYRSADDGADWTRMTRSPTPPYGAMTPSQLVQARGASTVWAINTNEIGTGTILRSTDRGGSWQRVLGTPEHRLAVQSFFALDARHAWLVTLASSRAGGVQFIVHRTADGGRHWSSATLPVPAGLH